MPAVDSTGAGDAMAAAVLASLWNDLDLAAATDLAQVMSLLAGAGVGAREMLPDQEQARQAWGLCYPTKMPELPRFTRPASPDGPTGV
ncbi:pfkB family carbohydrate kinase [Quadrisphaera granulorum]|uniref:PfkB family carbohydrate kinase n=1 Tax=Quadrisphaera granulorum TaxID=317664 RepID=A0A315ZU16_9ACTN|nr:pfkB family carbohydrate kinase [Quadrisphaera granulorum]SZE98395.1 pfkB family carbohydrate kinase [Quadrisphaera granulorum]